MDLPNEIQKSQELSILESISRSLNIITERGNIFLTNIKTIEEDQTLTENERNIINTFHEGIEKTYNLKELEVIENSIFQLMIIYIQRNIISKHKTVLSIVEHNDTYNLVSCLYKKINSVKISPIQIINFCTSCNEPRDCVINEMNQCPYFSNLDNESKCKCPRDGAYNLCGKCFYTKTVPKINKVLSKIDDLSLDSIHTCLIKCDSCGLWICPFYIDRVAIMKYGDSNYNQLFNNEYTFFNQQQFPNDNGGYFNVTGNNMFNASGFNPSGTNSFCLNNPTNQNVNTITNNNTTQKKQDRTCSLCKKPGHTRATCPSNLPREVVPR